MDRYEDRVDAGRRLGKLVAARIDGPSVVLAIPRAGVQVGAPVASALHAPLVPLLVRKVGLPENPDVVVGAIDCDGAMVVPPGARDLGLLPAELEGLAEDVSTRLLAWRRAFGAPDPAEVVPGHTAVVVDDALVTGLTLRAGVEHLRRRGAERIVVAVPVGRMDAIAEIEKMGVEVVAPIRAPPGTDMTQFYRRLPEVTEEEVAHLLARGGPSRPLPLQVPLTGERAIRLIDRETVAHPALFRLPEGAVPAPGVVLVGPGAEPGGELGERAGLRFAEAGIATLRFALEGGAPADTVVDLALDVLSARPEVDGLHLGLVAVGSAVPPATAVAQVDRRVAALALLGTVSVPESANRCLVVEGDTFSDRELDRIARWVADRLHPQR